MYEDRVITNFQDKKIPKENASYKCIAFIATTMYVVTIDCVIRMNKKYYPQAYLCECKYQIRKSRIEDLTNDDFNLSSSESESDYDSCSEHNDSEE